MAQSKTRQISSRVNFWMTFGFAVFIIMTIFVSTTPLFMQVGRMTACPGAESYTLSYEDDGMIKRVGSPNEIGTQTVGLSCAFADGSTKIVENDPLFGYSFLGTFIISVLAGVIMGGWAVWRNRSAQA